MAVLMVVGNIPRLPHSVFDGGYPLPALIANNYGEMMSVPLYDAALMLARGVLLLVVLFFKRPARLILVRGRTEGDMNPSRPAAGSGGAKQRR